MATFQDTRLYPDPSRSGVGGGGEWERQREEERRYQHGKRGSGSAQPLRRGAAPFRLAVWPRVVFSWNWAKTCLGYLPLPFCFVFFFLRRSGVQVPASFLIVGSFRLSSGSLGNLVCLAVWVPSPGRFVVGRGGYDLRAGHNQGVLQSWVQMLRICGAGPGKGK